GFEVYTAPSGPEALKLLEQRSYVLALLDIRMGSMNGIELLGEIKRRQPGVKAVMMTAYPTSDTRGKALENGAATYLTKPIDLQDLVKTIDTLLAS
ncbi:MAG: response regulator, partial [Gammaproteobacteria bacterium]